MKTLSKKGLESQEVVEVEKKKTKQEIIDDLCDTLGVKISKEDVKIFEHLQSKGIDLKTIKQMLKTPINEGKKKVINFGKGSIKVGIIGDTHLGAKSHDKEALDKYYNECLKRGVKAILHGGDMVDGHGVYQGQIFEQDRHGFDEQLQQVIKDYPKVGIPTYFVNGNHDESYLKNANIDIGRQIEAERPDLKYLGFYNGKISINNIDFELQHGGGGGSYALSYKLQKYIEKTDPRNLPDCYILGHYHQALYMVYRNVHSFLPGSFARENNLSRRFALGNTVGGWIVEMVKDKDNIKCETCFISF